MASRHEEKQKRREEREAAEKAAAAARARTKRLQMALAAVLAVGVIVGVVVAVSGGGSSGTGTSKAPAAAGAKTAAIPAAEDRDLVSAAQAAGCTLSSPPIEGRSHVTGNVVYKTNPPTSGNHNPDPALDGFYDPGNSPEPVHFVHALEHGRVEIQYKPGTPPHEVSQLKTLAGEPLAGVDAYKVLFFENNTKMPYQVAATAWGQMIACKTFTPKIFDAIRDFRVKYVDKGPEVGIPPN